MTIAVSKYKKGALIILIIISIVLCYQVFIRSKQVTPKKQIVVAAAASLQNVMIELESKYEQLNQEVDVVFTYGGSGTLQNQIKQGAPIDVFISASPVPMEALENKGLVTDVAELVQNTMVLIVPDNSPYTTLKFEECHEALRSIAIGDPESVPAGSYAKKIFEGLGTFDDIMSIATLGLDVTQVLSWVQVGNVEAGIVYQTDAKEASGVKRVDDAEELLDEPIIYPIGRVASSKDPEIAQDFIAFCLSEEGQQVFEDYGFLRYRK